MLVEVKVPQLSESVSEATLLNWHKKAGEFVQRDENLIDIETDKVVLELPAPESGVLKAIVKGDGGTVTSNEVIATIDTEAKAAAAVAGRQVVAIRRPAVAGVVVPAPASDHPGRARRGACRIDCSVCSIRPIPVLHPLPDIAMHVIEPPGVGLQLPHRVCLPSRIPVMPRIASELARLIPKAPAGRRPGTRRILPLRFRGQAVRRPAFSRIQPPGGRASSLAAQW